MAQGMPLPQRERGFLKDVVAPRRGRARGNAAKKPSVNEPVRSMDVRVQDVQLDQSGRIRDAFPLSLPDLKTQFLQLLLGNR